MPITGWFNKLSCQDSENCEKNITATLKHKMPKFNFVVATANAETGKG